MKRTATRKKLSSGFAANMVINKIKEDGVMINKPWKSGETVYLMAYLKSDSTIKKSSKSQTEVFDPRANAVKDTQRKSS